MRNLKIAIVTNSCWNIFNFRMELIQHLKQSGHEIIVISPVDEYILYLKDLPFTKHIPLYHLDAQRLSLRKDLLLLRELYKIYKNENPDIVFQFTIKPNIYGSLAAKFLNIKCVSNLTGLGYAFTSKKYKYILHQLYKYALSKNAKIVFHNGDDLEYFLKRKLIESNKGLIIYGSGVDTSKYKTEICTRDKGKTIYLFIGRLLKDKGIVEFVRAAIEARSIIKNAEFWIIGEFNASNKNSISKNELLSWIESRVIKYYGNSQDVKKYIFESDVVVLPSYREGLPRAILEAMSMNKPVIVTDVPGCKDLVIENWNGLLVPAKETHALAKAMVKVYNMSEDERKVWGTNSRNLVLNKYDLTIVIEAYDRLLKELFKKHEAIDHRIHV